jgi:hypothetical protein
VWGFSLLLYALMLIMLTRNAPSRTSADLASTRRRHLARAGVEYNTTYLNAILPTAARRAINPSLGGNWYTHRGLGTGICGVRNVGACQLLCNAIPGCLYFSTSTTAACYACFVSRTCDQSTAQYGAPGQ